MFVFYDTETTGLDLDSSQILQIALVFTDDDLNILSSKKLECRRSPWVVPSPGALLITGFAPDDLKFNPYSNYEMMRKVHDWINTQHWPLTFVGYNSLGYDEPILAQNSRQNLLDPHLTSSQNDANNQSNGRADIWLLVKTVALYMPGVLKLDLLNDYGKPSLTLQNVARQNGVALSDTEAHDAMNDIKATIGIAKLLRKSAPLLWEQMMQMSTVAGVEAFLATHQVFTCATTTYGKMTAKAMTSLTETTGSTTQVLYDLSVDPAPYLGMTIDQLKNAMAAKGGANPFTLIQKENQPVLMPLEMSQDALQNSDNENLYAARAQAVQSHQNFLKNVAQASLMLAKPAQAAASSVPAPVAQWMEEFHTAQNWRDSAQLIEDFYVRFATDLQTHPALARFAQLAEYIVYEHAPQELTARRRDSLRQEIAARVLNTDLKAPYMTIAKARKELETIELERTQGNPKWAHTKDGQIRALKLYYTSIEKEYTAYAPGGAAAGPKANTDTDSSPAPARPPAPNANHNPPKA